MTHRSKNLQPSFFEAGPPRVELRPKQKAELAATVRAQCRDELAHFQHPLTQALGVANEIGRDGEFAIPVAARDTRIVIWQVHEAGVPTELVKARGATAISNVRR